MKDIILLGAGGFAREVTWLIEDNNSVSPEWNILGYVANESSPLLKYPVLGNDDWLLSYEKEVNVVCCTGSSELREKIIRKYSGKKNIYFPSLISRHAIIGENVIVEPGTVICAGTIITVNVRIGKHAILNLDCTVGHEAILEDFVTLYPSVNVSGNVTIHNNTEIGTASAIIQEVEIGEHTIIGAGSAVVRNIPAWSTAVGVPCKVIKDRAQVV